MNILDRVAAQIERLALDHVHEDHAIHIFEQRVVVDPQNIPSGIQERLRLTAKTSEEIQHHGLHLHDNTANTEGKAAERPV